MVGGDVVGVYLVIEFSGYIGDLIVLGYLLRTFNFAWRRRDVTGIYSVLGAVSCFVPHALILSWVFVCLGCIFT